LEDALAVLGRQQFDEWTTTGGQTAGDRYDDILNRSEVAWNGGARDIDTGVSTLQADVVSWGSNVLNYCQLVAVSDLGLFFASRDGLLTFRDRHATIGAESVASFGGSGIGFTGVSITFGSEVFYTRVSVDREGGTAQTVESANAATDGIIPLSLTGLLQDSDSQALDMATFLANVYATGDAYISSITIDLNTITHTTDDIQAICRLDLADVVDVYFIPNDVGFPIEQSLVVYGIRHDRDPESHIVTLTLGRLEQSWPFILDDPVLGVLDGDSLLTF
jgi:hypothetical protein